MEARDRKKNQQTVFLHVVPVSSYCQAERKGHWRFQFVGTRGRAWSKYLKTKVISHSTLLISPWLIVVFTEYVVVHYESIIGESDCWLPVSWCWPAFTLCVFIFSCRITPWDRHQAEQRLLQHREWVWVLLSPRFSFPSLRSPSLGVMDQSYNFSFGTACFEIYFLSLLACRQGMSSRAVKYASTVIV